MMSWMKLLSNHYERARRRHRGEKLLVLFDIDGTILDMRHVILYVLRQIDKKNGSDRFARLKVSDIRIHEDDMDLFLDRLAIKGAEKECILSSFWTDLWSSTAVVDAHRPFHGVFDVIRWFQLQPGTYVGLNTGRPEALRFNTLSSLNKLGRRATVLFRDDLLFMKPDDWPGTIPEVKVHGVEYFRRMGYRPIAMIDNEPENLEAITVHATGRGMLLLHADTISRSGLTLTSKRIVRGVSYDLNELSGGSNLKRSA
jgi:hypothetical protein